MSHTAPVARAIHRKMASFALIGVVNTVVDASLFALLLWLPVPVLVANFLAWFCAASLSYRMNARWTFDPAPHAGRLRAYLRFLSSGALVSLLCSTLLLALLAGVIGVWPAKAIAIALGAVLGFLAARWSIEGPGGPANALAPALASGPAVASRLSARRERRSHRT